VEALGQAQLNILGNFSSPPNRAWSRHPQSRGPEPLSTPQLQRRAEHGKALAASAVHPRENHHHRSPPFEPGCPEQPDSKPREPTDAEHNFKSHFSLLNSLF